MPSPKIHFYTPQELEAIAEVFLKKYHHPPDSLPVKIYTIAEADLKIEVYPFLGLEREYGLQGYLALSLRRIRIDQRIMDEDRYERRFRFTVAEEIAHLILHKELFEGVETPEDYIDAHDKISERENTRMDMDAKHLAEAILLPTELFTKQTLKFAIASKKNVQLTKEGLFKKLADIFVVSTSVVDYRFWRLGLGRQIELDR